MAGTGLRLTAAATYRRRCHITLPMITNAITLAMLTNAITSP